jgi:hypothetical protein
MSATPKASKALTRRQISSDWNGDWVCASFHSIRVSLLIARAQRQVIGSFSTAEKRVASASRRHSLS